jgi:hypothetical protein
MSLRGKSAVKNTLRGIRIPPLEIEKLKVFILNQWVLPFTSKQWDILGENVLFIDVLKQKINLYLSIDASLKVYKDFLEVIAYAYHEHVRLVELEQFTCSELSLSTKLPPIRIKPEYEIYHVLFGKGLYDLGILDDIVRLLAIPFMTLDQIREILSTRNICFR